VGQDRVPKKKKEKKPIWWHNQPSSSARGPHIDPPGWFGPLPGRGARKWEKEQGGTHPGPPRARAPRIRNKPACGHPRRPEAGGAERPEIYPRPPRGKVPGRGGSLKKNGGGGVAAPPACVEPGRASRTDEGPVGWANQGGPGRGGGGKRKKGARRGGGEIDSPTGERAGGGERPPRRGVTAGKTPSPRVVARRGEGRGGKARSPPGNKAPPRTGLWRTSTGPGRRGGGGPGGKSGQGGKKPRRGCVGGNGGSPKGGAAKVKATRGVRGPGLVPTHPRRCSGPQGSEGITPGGVGPESQREELSPPGGRMGPKGGTGGERVRRKASGAGVCLPRARHGLFLPVGKVTKQLIAQPVPPLCGRTYSGGPPAKFARRERSSRGRGREAGWVMAGNEIPSRPRMEKAWLPHRK